MRYIIAGDGTLPLKEIPDVIEELNPSSGDEVVYICGKGTRFKVGETLMDGFETFVVAVPNEEVAADLSPKLQGATDIVLWDPEVDLIPHAPSGVEVLALIPAAGEPADVFLEELVEAALSIGVRCRAMNEQMYDLDVETPGDPEVDTAEPVPEAVSRGLAEEVPEAEPVEIPTAAAMEAMPRADLKALAKAVHAVPEDWRSKQKIITAILQTQVDADTTEPYEAPSSLPDLAQLEAEVAALPEPEAPETVRIEGIEVPIPTGASPVQSESLLGEGLVSVLEGLLTDMSRVINDAREALKALD